MPNLVLKTISLNKRFGKNIIALNNVNIHLQKGCILGLLGPNGSGKSTLINILANIVKKDSGEVYIFNKKIKDYSYQYKSSCGFVFEQPFYINKFTIQEYLRFSAVLYGLNDNIISKRIEEVLDFFELMEKQHEWIERCSKGIKKRVSIATSLIHKPKLLVLDEPLTDLDVIMTKKLKDLFKKLRNKEISVLISSHNITDLEDICDDVHIFKNGNIIFKHSNHFNLVKNNLIESDKLSLKLNELFFDLFKERLPHDNDREDL